MYRGWESGKIETVIWRHDQCRNMSKRNAIVILAFVCLAVILVAGCTSSTTGSNAQAGSGPAATTMTQVSTPGAATPAASSGTPAASQDPIVGTWSTPTVQGKSAQVVFGADGSFTGYLNGGSQVMKSGTWQSAGSSRYTVTIAGQDAPVIWDLDGTTNMAYNIAYPDLKYTRTS
jgi:outer membrane murein-binding lipoprotein Lpp